MSKIYITKSNKANPTITQLVKQLLQKQGHDIIEYSGGKYDPAIINDAEAMVAVSEFLNGIVGKGQNSEISIGLERKIPVYGIVKTTDITIHDTNEEIISKLRIGLIKELELIDAEDYRTTARFKGEKGTSVDLNQFIL